MLTFMCLDVTDDYYVSTYQHGIKSVTYQKPELHILQTLDNSGNLVYWTDKSRCTELFSHSSPLQWWVV